MTKYQGTGYANGFNVNAEKPIDVRLVVDTTTDRNNLEFTYPGMPVCVLGPVLVVGGHDTYPQAVTYHCLVDKVPNFSGPTTTDADWKRDLASSVQGTTYKGAWDASTNTPDLTDPALLATLAAGAFYKVSVAGNANLSSISTWAQNDSAFWDGARWTRFENTNPQPIKPLYADTEGQLFLDDVLALIRSNALKQWQAGTYLAGAYVKDAYVENGRRYVDTWQANRNMNAASAALPTDATPNPGWDLVTTTNGRKLGGTATGDDTVGKAATGTYAPATRTPNVYTSPEEIDARIQQYGGGDSTVFGGDAATFLTADPNEAPRN